MTTTDQATRHALIQSAVRIAGAVPTIRAMATILALDGIRVTTVTIGKDYEALGYQSPASVGRKRTGTTSTSVKCFRVSNPDYDFCCHLARERDAKVATVIREMIAVGVRYTRSQASGASKTVPTHRKTA